MEVNKIILFNGGRNDKKRLLSWVYLEANYCQFLTGKLDNVTHESNIVVIWPKDDQCKSKQCKISISWSRTASIHFFRNCEFPYCVNVHKNSYFTSSVQHASKIGERKKKTIYATFHRDYFVEYKIMTFRRFELYRRMSAGRALEKVFLDLIYKFEILFLFYSIYLQLPGILFDLNGKQLEVYKSFPEVWFCFRTGILTKTGGAAACELSSLSLK